MAQPERSDAAPARSARPRRWSWVQFWCAFVVATLGGFLNVEVMFGLDWLPAHLLKTFVIALTFACLAGRYGDSVWLWLACLISC